METFHSLFINYLNNKQFSVRVPTNLFIYEKRKFEIYMAIINWLECCKFILFKI